MAQPVNLNRFRKEKARAEKRARADANAAKFGRTKAERIAQQARQDRATATLDGHALSDGDETGEDPPKSP